MSTSEIADQITNIQSANSFIQLVVTASDGFELTPEQQSGAAFLLQKINEELESVKSSMKEIIIS